MTEHRRDRRQHQAFVRFWGVRGSIPSPGPGTAAVGGNTSCVEVRLGPHRVVIDAGSGLRQLGLAQGSLPLRGSLLIGHLHWDHIQGLPFCGPLYNPSSRMALIGPEGLDEALHRQMSGPTFPVELDALAAQIRSRTVAAGQSLRLAPDLRLRTAPLRHPGGGVAYRLDWRGHSVVYACDTEQPPEGIDGALRALAERADLLIHDAQYLPEECPQKVGWGHSSYDAAAELARAAEVGTLLLTHHDPTRSDRAVEAIEARAQRLFFNTFAAREGAVHPLNRRAADRRGLERGIALDVA